MPEKIKPQHVLEYALYRCAESLISALPRSLALSAGAAVGALLYYLGVYRKVVEKNFDHVGLFPEKKALIRKLYRNIGRYGAEFLRTTTTPPAYNVNNYAAAQAAFDQGKGTCIILAHLGNWEMLATIFGSRLPDLNVLARPLSNPLTERWVFSKRQKTRVTPLYAARSLRKLVTVIKRNGCIAMLIDQYSGRNGSTVDFLGKPANTVLSAAWLIQRMECSAIFARAILDERGAYRIDIEPWPDIPLPPTASEEEKIAALQKIHNDVLSRWIIEHPDHYFGWFHKRYKHTNSY